MLSALIAGFIMLKFFTLFTKQTFNTMIFCMRRFILYLTAYNIIFTLSRLVFAVVDPGNSFLRALQFHDNTIYVLIPVFIFWSLLYFTIPAAIYVTVGSATKRINRFNLSTLTINSAACLTMVMLCFMFGFNY